MADAHAPRLDPYFARRAAELTGVTLDRLGEPEAFARYAADDDDSWAPDSSLSIEEHALAADSPVVVRVYRPAVTTGHPLVWMHGGGFAFGDLDMLEAHAVSAELARRSGSVVVSVAYRLASESVRFPLPVDDVVAAWRWARDELGLDAPALGGASAGAALAVSAALRCASDAAPPRALLLAYPFLHFPTPAPDAATAAALADLPPVLRLTAPVIAQLVAGYVGRVADVPAEAMPGAARLNGLPETHLVVAEIDDLRASADLFAAQLAESRVPARIHLAHGMPHGFLNRVPSLPGVSAALDVFAEALRRPS